MTITKKNFQDEKFPHDLLLTTGQKAKIRNALADNMLTDIKLSKTQLSKIIKSEGFIGWSSWSIDEIAVLKMFWHH